MNPFGNKMKRIFFGIPVSDLEGKSIQEAISSLKKEWERVRWIPTENWHITVHFLGEVDESLLPSLITTVETMTNRFQSFSLKGNKIAEFPPEVSHSNRGMTSSMLALYLNKNKDLDHLFEIFNEITNRLNLPLEKYAFIPHITLAKFKQPLPITSILLDHFNLKVETLILYESRSDEKGSHYVPLKTFKLRS